MRSTIFSVILVLVLIGALAVAAVVALPLAGAFELGVRVGQSNVMRAVESSELALIFIAAVAVAAAALLTLYRLRAR